MLVHQALSARSDQRLGDAGPQEPTKGLRSYAKFHENVRSVRIPFRKTGHYGLLLGVLLGGVYARSLILLHFFLSFLLCEHPTLPLARTHPHSFRLVLGHADFCRRTPLALASGLASFAIKPPLPQYMVLTLSCWPKTCGGWPLQLYAWPLPQVVT